MRTALPFLLAATLAAALPAQEFSYGFKAGLNSNHFQADSETDDQGNELETFTNNVGFHVGVAFTWKITDLVGVRGEFLFSQKGGRRKYIGPSYFTFRADDGTRIFSTGTRDQRLNVTLSYLDFPLTGYYKPFEWLELSGGVSVGVLVGASAFGELKYSGVTGAGNPVEEFLLNLDHQYGKDEPGEADFGLFAFAREINSKQVIFPSQAGAYFEFEEDRGNLYKTLELGAVGGISLYLNRALFLSFRAHFGLSDVTNSRADVSLFQLDADRNFIPRDDDDRNFSFQTSIGFAF